MLQQMVDNYSTPSAFEIRKTYLTAFAFVFIKLSNACYIPPRPPGHESDPSAHPARRGREPQGSAHASTRPVHQQHPLRDARIRRDQGLLHQLAGLGDQLQLQCRVPELQLEAREPDARTARADGDFAAARESSGVVVAPRRESHRRCRHGRLSVRIKAGWRGCSMSSTIGSGA
ncbi:hypothetical protein HD806DRAFT_510261 [Xylariaceae sp. AK1471]|nr:hypothetical protein HD806DRAFT_510261 [Xylariaceae sp. AK1471]